jgi:hypothetical protein
LLLICLTAGAQYPGTLAPDVHSHRGTPPGHHSRRRPASHRHRRPRLYYTLALILPLALFFFRLLSSICCRFNVPWESWTRRSQSPWHTHRLVTSRVADLFAVITGGRVAARPFPSSDPSLCLSSNCRSRSAAGAEHTGAFGSNVHCRHRRAPPGHHSRC